MQRQFSLLESPIEFNLIDEDEFEIEFFYPHVVFSPVSTTRASYQILTVHHPNPFARAQPTS